MYRPFCRRVTPTLQGFIPSSFAARTPTVAPWRISSRSMSTQTHRPLKFKPISAAVALTVTASLLYTMKPTVSAEQAPPKLTFGAPSSATVADLLDDKNRTVMRSKATSELVLALLVYKLCTFSWLVEAAPHLIAMAERLHLQQPVYSVIRNTFFRQFCGGETPEECLDRMESLARSGIHCILDLSVEADLHGEECVSMAEQEAMADKITQMTEHSIRVVGQGSSNASAFAAIKITAFAPPSLLLRLDQAMTGLQAAFQKYQQMGRLDAAGLEKILNDHFPSPQQETVRTTLLEKMRQSSVTIDQLEFTQLLDLQHPQRDLWWKTNKGLLTLEELEAYDRMVGRLERVCTLAHTLHVGIMVDAEQSYFQEAIDHMAMNLQEKYNKRTSESTGPTVFNTYQMYTKAARGKLELDVERARRGDFTFAAKLVRGAYMVSERKRAEQLGYSSPIHDTLEDTHTSYNEGVAFLLQKLNDHQQTTEEPLAAASSPITFMVASHNRDSVILALQEMEKNNVSRHAGIVHFGQLFGMHDIISYTLGRHGYSIYKYLPYGEIHEVIPYLLRRAQENSAVLGGVAKERALMAAELKDRWTGRSMTAKPVSSGSPAETA
ncbi:FAD-linked oxidoreductase-like protein [Spinellus fusiger]|nr:FAD-linked oxidoreductase-like protein [Spinellus fusiger]